MGRKSGVAAEETRTAVLEAAAKVFSRRGYDGASIADITAEAGLTSGALYSHWSSKAELFAATIEAFGQSDLDRLLSAGGPGLLEGLTAVGSTLDRRESIEESLLISAVIAARDHPEVATLLRDLMTGQERTVTSLIEAAQAAGTLAADVSAPALSRLSLAIALGSLVAGAFGADPVDHDGWVDLIGRLTGALTG